MRVEVTERWPVEIGLEQEDVRAMAEAAALIDRVEDALAREAAAQLRGLVARVARALAEQRLAQWRREHEDGWPIEGPPGPDSWERWHGGGDR